MAVKKILEPADPAERLRGWLLHAHKCRDRHDEAARSYDSLRYALGVPTALFSALAGASAFAALTDSLGSEGKIVAGVVGVFATVLAILQTTYDYPGRAGQNRLAATKFKALIRELEQALTGPQKADRPEGWVDDLRRRLDGLEETSPQVSQKIYDRVERRYENVAFVSRVLDLVAPG
jgi:hypothetical protein